ncbi:MAG TPA: tol-pal system protein YbgF [Longimicrobiales bacterium]|nr:tol-pal system protein YbgF [Longimicrobiales bacterium]
MRRLIPSTAGRATVLLAAVLSVSSCATKRDVRDLQTELATELRRIAAAQDSLRVIIVQQSLQTQDTLRNASRELGDIRGDVLNQLTRISRQLDQLGELAGQNSLAIASLRDQMQTVGRSSPAAGGGGEGDFGVSGGSMSEGTGAADASYNAAVRQYNRGSLTAARAAFQQFLAAHPSSDLAPQAHYYLADVMVQEEDLDGAIEEFSKVFELFPSASAVPDALYRVGLLHMELGNEEEAQAFFERVVNTYPDSRVAEFARARLGEIGSPAP